MIQVLIEQKGKERQFVRRDVSPRHEGRREGREETTRKFWKGCTSHPRSPANLTALCLSHIAIYPQLGIFGFARRSGSSHCLGVIDGAGIAIFLVTIGLTIVGVAVVIAAIIVVIVAIDRSTRLAVVVCLLVAAVSELSLTSGTVAAFSVSRDAIVAAVTTFASAVFVVARERLSGWFLLFGSLRCFGTSSWLDCI